MNDSVSQIDQDHIDDALHKRNMFFNEALLDFEALASRTLTYLRDGHLTSHAAYRFLMNGFQRYEEDMQFYQDQFEIEVGF